MSRPILLQGRRIGTLVLLYDLGEIYERIQMYGEIVLVIEGGSGVKKPEAEADAGVIEEEIREMKRLGLMQSQAAALLSRRYSVSHRRLYELWLKED